VCGGGEEEEGLTNDEYGRVVVEEHERAQARSDAEGGAGGSHVRGEQLGEGGAAARLLHKPDRAAEQEGEKEHARVVAWCERVDEVRVEGAEGGGERVAAREQEAAGEDAKK